MIVTLENGCKYRLVDQDLEHFQDVYGDCLLLEDGKTRREYYVGKIMELSKSCSFDVDEDVANDIFNDMLDHKDTVFGDELWTKLEKWTELDFLEWIHDYLKETYYDPSMVSYTK